MHDNQNSAMIFEEVYIILRFSKAAFYGLFVLGKLTRTTSHWSQWISLQTYCVFAIAHRLSDASFQWLPQLCYTKRQFKQVTQPHCQAATAFIFFFHHMALHIPWGTYIPMWEPLIYSLHYSTAHYRDARKASSKVTGFTPKITL